MVHSCSLKRIQAAHSAETLTIFAHLQFREYRSCSRSASHGLSLFLSHTHSLFCLQQQQLPWHLLYVFIFFFWLPSCCSRLSSAEVAQIKEATVDAVAWSSSTAALSLLWIIIWFQFLWGSTMLTFFFLILALSLRLFNLYIMQLALLLTQLNAKKKCLN